MDDRKAARELADDTHRHERELAEGQREQPALGMTLRGAAERGRRDRRIRQVLTGSERGNDDWLVGIRV